MIGDFLKGFQLLSQRSPNPFQLIFVDIWNNIIEANIKAFTNIDEIVEFTIRLAKYGLRILGRLFDPYLVKFLQLVIQAY